MVHMNMNVLQYLNKNSDVLNNIQALVSSRWKDSKDVVDMPLKVDIEVVRRRLERIRDDDEAKDTTNEVIRDCFALPGSDVIPTTPSDWTGYPQGLIDNLEDTAMRTWACELHAIWCELCRKMSPDVHKQPHFHTLIDLPHCMFVPGSRFREQYYWDSYFVVKGLLVSGMHDSATKVALNLLHCIDQYGFVPNGTRSYYLHRTQPPLLSEILVELWAWAHHNSEGAQERRDSIKSLLRVSLPKLLLEHKFITQNKRMVSILKNGRTYKFARYHADSSCPRPESYREDIESARTKIGTDIFVQIATMAESGWDFSSRWLKDHGDISTSHITKIIPVDLNTILAKMEENIATIAEINGEGEIQGKYQELANERFSAIDNVLWDEQASQWKDYHLDEDIPKCVDFDLGGELSEGVYASNWFPLWGSPAEAKAMKAVCSLTESGLVSNGGIATSMYKSGQQWDYPNAWAPLQYVIVEGLLHSGGKGALGIAEKIAKDFCRNAHEAYLKTGKMHEKYNAIDVGHVGGGGEYQPQTGFGWTNGVVLAFLEKFYTNSPP